MFPLILILGAAAVMVAVSSGSSAASGAAQRVYGMHRGATKFLKTKIGDTVFGTVRFYDAATKILTPVDDVRVRVTSFDPVTNKFRAVIIETSKEAALMGINIAIIKVPDDEDETSSIGY